MATQKYSVEVRDTDTCWHREDTEILHRLGGPAFISSDRKEWYKDGRLHREDGPAIEYANGSKHWYLDGKRHRSDGPAIERLDGTKFWYSNDVIHREDGPAIKWANGDLEWYLNGQRHREAGPAVKFANGRNEWWLDGKKVTRQQHKQLTAAPVEEMTMAQLEAALGKRIKIIK